MALPEPTLERLTACLAEGLNDQPADWTEGMDGVVLPSDKMADRELAQMVVEELAEEELRLVNIEHARPTDPRETELDDAVSTADTSLLGQLESGLNVGTIDNVPTLLAILRGGSLFQRRAALMALGERIATGKGIGNEVVRTVTSVINATSSIELAYERALVLERMSGSIGRAARAEHEAWKKLVQQIESSIRGFWDGENSEEPFGALAGDVRVRVLVRTRDVPNLVIEHLSAMIENSDGISDRSMRLTVITWLRYAGDSRLVPPLSNVLSEGGEISTEAARALGYIDDPRVRVALRTAFARTVVEIPRCALSGALAHNGDFRGAAYCRGLLDTNNANLLVAALDALSAVGGAEDSDRVAALLEHEDVRVREAAVKTLARTGDARVLPRLAVLAQSAPAANLLAVLDDARDGIVARMELRGEELEVPRLAAHDHPVANDGEVRTYSLRVRMGTFWNFFLGQFWLALGGVHRAIVRFERAAERRPSWCLPLVMIAMAHLRKKRYPQALTAFRRALEADRTRVERNPVAVRALTQTFLRRSEQMEQEGRVDVARGLIEELRSLDLRRVRTDQQMEIRVRIDALRRRLTS